MRFYAHSNKNYVISVFDMFLWDFSHDRGHTDIKLGLKDFFIQIGVNQEQTQRCRLKKIVFMS